MTVSEIEAPPRPVRERAGWIDIAKAISIMLVVLHHAVGRLDGLPAAVETLNQSLISLRMPLFFFAAGLFVANAMKLSFSELTSKRLVQLLYIFVLWSAIRLVVLGSADAFVFGEPVDWNLMMIFIEPPQTLWFIYALMIFTVMVWLVRWAAPWMVVVVALVAYIAFFGSGELYGLTFGMRIPRMFLWFAAGYAMSVWVRRTGPMMPSWASAAVIVWLGAAIIVMPGERTEWWILLPFSAAAIGCGLLLALALSRTPLDRPLEYIGRNTLPIYVAHFFVVYPALLLKDAGPGVSICALLIIWAAGVGLPLIGKEIAHRARLQWLFEAPGFLKSLPLRRRVEAPL